MYRSEHLMGVAQEIHYNSRKNAAMQPTTATIRRRIKVPHQIHLNKQSGAS
jgi:hypothetical protein